MNTVNNNPLHLGLEVVLADGRQDYESEIDLGTIGWYSPREYLRRLEGVVRADYIEMSSSAGDWSGWYAVRMDEGFVLVTFSQENRFPDCGYKLYTDSAPFARVESENDIDEVVNEYISCMFGDSDVAA